MSQISRLYKPVTLDPNSPIDSDSEEDMDGTNLLPLHSMHPTNSSKSKATPSKNGNIRLGDVWDEREELFGIGDSDDDHDTAEESRRLQSAANNLNVPPKILVTSS